MEFYSVKTPSWLPKFFPKELIWRKPEEAAVYLTFDDGPHQEATSFVLDTLERYNAYATFFCIGKNIASHPELFERIKDSGHVVGNHTYDHLNGWKNYNDAYLKNIYKTTKYVENKIFRPPYGRIKISQSKKLIRKGWKIYMWDVLSADFDTEITPEACLENVIRNIQPGSIIVFHDSEKAFPRMRYALPGVLEYCQKRGWKMKTLL